MAEDIAVTVSILVGLAAIGFAILERGYKRYLEEKKIVEAEGKTLNFDMAYLVNMVISSGTTAAFVAAVPLLIEAVGATTQLTFVSLLLNAVSGYTLAYRILDGLNKTTDNKIETARLVKENKASRPT